MDEASSHSKPPVALLPSLYEETGIEAALIQTLQMGPWQHNVDDGLETRNQYTEDCVSPRLFKCLLVLIIRPVHSSIYVLLSLTSVSSLDTSFLAFLTTRMKLKLSRT